MSIEHRAQSTCLFNEDYARAMHAHTTLEIFTRIVCQATYAEKDFYTKHSTPNYPAHIKERDKGML